mmetsp:Transcript_1065/g.3383  ORF Transcript_1065/g.3383 Transcript_1065/m.3383 type:complete len:230 (-) Transcript_1065:118-807(-)
MACTSPSPLTKTPPMVSSRARPRSNRTTSSLTARKRGTEARPTSMTQVSRTLHGWNTGSAASSFDSPTNMHSSPTWSGTGESRAVATEVPARSAGLYLTMATLCVGWRKTGTAATSTVDANSMRVLPSAIGTVFRSTSTSPTCASTTRPAPAYWSAATPSIWYGMSKKTRTMDGVIIRTSGGPATAKLTVWGAGGGGGGGGGAGGGGGGRNYFGAAGASGTGDNIIGGL